MRGVGLSACSGRLSAGSERLSSGGERLYGGSVMYMFFHDLPGLRRRTGLDIFFVAF